jgi:peptidoglycan/xylan/chitin deacetylase (PgdA/CDA1 family)
LIADGAPPVTDPALQVCLTFDVDAVSLWTETFKASSPSDISRGEFGPRVAVPRILRLLEAHGIPATFFVPAVTVRQFPEAIGDIVAAGHELGAHGDRHERLVKLDRAEEAEVHRRSVETLTEAAGVAPRGFRAPGWELSASTIELIEELGFAYDSSQMATDFTPYPARRGDVAAGGEWTPGPESSVCEIPVAWELDDFPHFFLKPPYFLPARSVADVEASWRAEFDYACASVPDGVFTLTMHPQIIGRGPRLEMLERLIVHMASRPGVQFSTAGDAAGRWSRWNAVT